MINMSDRIQEAAEQQQREQDSLSSTSTSISLIKLDELSSFGATKQNRLPTLIKLNNDTNKQQQQQQLDQLRPKQTNSMPAFTADQLEQHDNMSAGKQQVSLPANLELSRHQAGPAEPNPHNINKENEPEDGDFQLVDMVGPSLPQPDKMPAKEGEQTSAPFCSTADPAAQQHQVQHHPSGAGQQLLSQPGNIGDSLIEMVINLRNENQNLVRALEANNEYVKERISEFKRAQEEAKRREAQFALEKADHEHQSRKLKRQNNVLGERLKSLEAKLNCMKLEVNESLDAARSSKASSSSGDEQQQQQQLYPNLGDGESFQAATTMQIDATNQELLNNQQDSPQTTTIAPQQMETETREATTVANMTKEELSERFDANKAEFYALDDPMKQCDRLEKQLNDIGKRDYEICLLQQQLNIYRQDFRLERMEKLEAKIQIEKLKNDIDRLCLDRINAERAAAKESPASGGQMHRGSHHRRSGGERLGVRFDPAAAADAVFSKLGHHMSKKAAKSAAKAAKYASKQAHREERVVAAAAAAAAANMAVGGEQQPTLADNRHHHGHRRHHHERHARVHPNRGNGMRSEVVSDLLSTANKAMMTGYKMASTHVNLALDKLSAYEQQQAANLAANQPATLAGAAPSAPPAQSINHPSLD